MSGGAVAPKDGKLLVLSSDGADCFSEMISGVFFLFFYAWSEGEAEMPAVSNPQPSSISAGCRRKHRDNPHDKQEENNTYCETFSHN